jgi:hypothetical protein
MHALRVEEFMRAISKSRQHHSMHGHTVSRAAMRHGACALPWNHSHTMMLLSALPDARAFVEPALGTSWSQTFLEVLEQGGEHCRPRTSAIARQPFYAVYPSRMAQKGCHDLGILHGQSCEALDFWLLRGSGRSASL